MYRLHDVLRMNPIEEAAAKYQKRFLEKKNTTLKNYDFGAIECEKMHFL